VEYSEGNDKYTYCLVHHCFYYIVVISSLLHCVKHKWVFKNIVLNTWINIFVWRNICKCSAVVSVMVQSEVPRYKVSSCKVLFLSSPVKTPLKNNVTFSYIWSSLVSSFSHLEVHFWVLHKKFQLNTLLFISWCCNCSINNAWLQTILPPVLDPWTVCFWLVPSFLFY